MECMEMSEVWYTRCPVPTSSCVAIDHGMLDAVFAPEGIVVSSLGASPSTGVHNSHFDHSQENSFREGGNIPPIWARSQGGDTRAIASAWVDEYQAIIGLPNSGVKTVKDLRGRRLAMPRRVNDTIDYWRAMCLRGYLNALEVAGIDRSEVEFVDIPIEENYIGPQDSSRTGSLWVGAHRARRQQAESFALIRGEVDAIYTAGAPGLQLTSFLDAGIVFDLGSHPDEHIRVNNQVPIVLTVSGHLISEKPEIVQTYLQTLIEAAEWSLNNKDATIRTIANDVGASEEWVRKSYPNNFSAHLKPTWNDNLIGALNAQKDFLLREGFIEFDFDMNEWIDQGPLSIVTQKDKTNVS